MEDKKIVALYMRSSLEQDEKTRNVQNPNESDTIANQRKMLHKAVENYGFPAETIREYIDDGHSGVNFDRPGFLQLISDVDAGLIGVVIIKDFSRLGRDYIGVGELAENYFPVHGVRLISVNDRWDSDEHKGETLELDASFRTIIYDMYSRDLSIKRISSNRARNKRGIYSSSETPYGYLKDPKDKHKLIIDEKTAPIVRRVFELYLSGEKIRNIAKILTDEGAPTPARAKADEHDYSNNTSDLDIWNTTAVSRILRNEMYTGTLVLNRFSIKDYKSDTCVINDPSEWLKFPDDHEPIISQEDYDKVRKRLGNQRKVPEEIVTRKRYPLYCGHCGYKLARTTRNSNTMICPHGAKVPADECGQIEIRNDRIQSIIIKAINKQAEVLLEKAKGSKIDSKAEAELKKLVGRLEREKDEYHSERMALYRQFNEGKLSRELFLQKKQSVLKLEEECLNELDAAREKLAAQVGAMDEIRKSAEKFSEYAFMDEYDEAVVNRLIRRIEAFNDGHIKISWNYIDEFSDEVDPADKRGKAEADDVSGVVAYTSDMYLIPQEISEHDSKAVLEYYFSTYLDGLPVRWLRDDKADKGLFYRKGYMDFINAGRTGAASVMVISSFHDLYLSHRALDDLLNWILPKLKCRFISVLDDYDSTTATEADRKLIYEKYRHECKGDQTRYRKILRDEGVAKAKVPSVPRCTNLYGYYHTDEGCFAVSEILDIVKELYRIAFETGKMRKVTRFLREQNAVTPKSFFYQHGQTITDENHAGYWNGEKTWGVIKQKGYAEPCKYYEKCMALGRHCERKPIVTADVFEEVNTKLRYRKNR